MAETTIISAVARNVEQPTARIVEVTNPAVDRTSKVEISESAKAALDQIGQMQNSFVADMDAHKVATEVDLQASMSKPGMTPEAMLAESVEAMRMQTETSRAVQEQLTRFAMVSSVATSFGRNLNMFLRGQ